MPRSTVVNSRSVAHHSKTEKNEPTPAPAAVEEMETLRVQDILKAQESQMPQELGKRTESPLRNEQCACGERTSKYRVAESA